MLPQINLIRAGVDVRPVASVDEFLPRAALMLVASGKPLQYPQTDSGDTVHMIGPCVLDPDHGAVPDWLDAIDLPIVLVTTSSEKQADTKLVQTAMAAFADEPLHVVATLPAGLPEGLAASANATIYRLVPHAVVLNRAVCAVTHGGMGATQKALAVGVPVCAAPFGRDQFEVARRVEVAGCGTRLPATKLSPGRLRSKGREATTMTPGARRVAQGLRLPAGRPAAPTSRTAGPRGGLIRDRRRLAGPVGAAAEVAQNPVEIRRARCARPVDGTPEGRLRCVTEVAVGYGQSQRQRGVDDIVGQGVGHTQRFGDVPAVDHVVNEVETDGDGTGKRCARAEFGKREGRLKRRVVGEGRQHVTGRVGIRAAGLDGDRTQCCVDSPHLGVISQSPCGRCESAMLSGHVGEQVGELPAIARSGRVEVSDPDGVDERNGVQHGDTVGEANVGNISKHLLIICDRLLYGNA